MRLVQPKAISWAKVTAVVEPLSILGLYVYLLAHSWLRWIDPLVDFPKDLYFAWRIAEGDLMYQQLANWYGPLAQLVQGAAFRLFGVGVDTMIWSNIVLTTGVVFLLRDIFGTLGNRLTGWLSAVVFLGVFAFGHYIHPAEFNFFAPYAAASTYSFAGLLVVLWGLLHHLKSECRGWLALAGLGLAITYLDKPEALLAALGSLAIYFLACIIRTARAQPPAVDWRGATRWSGMAMVGLAGGFFGLWLPIFIYFWLRGGLRLAVFAADYVPYTMLASRFRHMAMTAPIQRGFIGIDQPWFNFVRQSWAGLALGLVCLVMAGAARRWTRTPKYGLGWWGWLVVVAAAGGLGAWLAEDKAAHWLQIGAAIVFPVIIAASITVGWSFWSAWTGRANWARLLGLAVVGVAAALMLARMILNGRVYQFGFFMMPLAVLWIIHLMVFEVAQPVPQARRANRLLPTVFSAVVLVGVVALARISFNNYAIKNTEVGEGRDRFLTFTPEVSQGGAILYLLEEAFKETTPRAKTLVVFPEGIAVNYYLRVPTTMAELEFHPVALGYVGPAHVLDELKSHPPESIILFNYNFEEFGALYFGADAASGRDLVLWMNDHYTLAASAGHTQKTVTHHEIDVLTPGAPSSTGAELLHDASAASLPAGPP